MYEGTEPYAFISYSHTDKEWVQQIASLLEENRLRFWYDNGLHAGDDWNMVIANRLEGAAICLLLLSPASSQSVYVKNELNFAISHNVPIFTLLLASFSLPLDLEMMLGRLQMTEASGNYREELLAALPPELSTGNEEEVSGTTEQVSRWQGESESPYIVERILMDRQGTLSYLGRHKRLKYPCLVQVDPVREGEEDALWEQAELACSIRHPLFPQIYDMEIREGRMWSYQEYRGEQFLDQYLRQFRLSEEMILAWADDVLGAVETLRQKKLGLREFSRGSMVVLENNRIGMFRLNNPYYGVVRLRPDTQSMYFRKETQSIALLLAQLCSGKVSTLPVGLLKTEYLSQPFQDKINLVIQKCMGTEYTSFSQIREQLNAKGISASDKTFLRGCAEQLAQFAQRMKHEQQQLFTYVENSGMDNASRMPVRPEEPAPVRRPDAAGYRQEAADSIVLQICATGEIRKFCQSSVTIGRSMDCDLVLNRATVSRHHARIEKTDGEYRFYDLSPTNGSYISGVKVRTAPGESIIISKGDCIRAGTEELRVL